MQPELITIKEHAQRLIAEHQARARIEARIAELQAHHQRLADELRIVGTVVAELEAVLNAPVVTEGQEHP